MVWNYGGGDNLRRYSGGLVSFDVTCGDVSQTLKVLTGQGISLYDVIHKNEISVMFSVSFNDVKAVKHILSMRGDGFQQIALSPGSVFLKKVKKRWLLILAIFLLLGLSIWLPSRILFVNVIGNSTVSTVLLEEKIAAIGLRFGIKRADIRSESLKNVMLSEIPELDWVGITTVGCVATIEIREKPNIEKESVKPGNIASIVADTDGVIEEITVTRGIALCRKGQAVKKGQVLISCYEDCGFLIKATQAEGEVTAQTMRRTDAVCPSKVSMRGQIKRVDTSYHLLIGKKFINFKNNSGISPTSCVKIYEEKYMTLPGGYQLPIALILETKIFYDTEGCILREDNFEWMEQGIEQYTAKLMSAGTILNKKYIGSMQENYFQAKSFYICREEIGKYRIEETLIHDRKDS